MNKVMILFLMLLSGAMLLGAEEVEIYRSKEPMTSLEVDLLKVHLEVNWVKQSELTIQLVGDGAREFRHKVRYQKSSGVLHVGEEVALGQRVSDYWENRDVAKEEKPLDLLMIINIPHSFQSIPYRFKVWLGSVTLNGNSVRLQQSLQIQTLQGFIAINQLQSTRIVLKSTQGNMVLNNVGFDFAELQNIHGDVDIVWGSKSKIFLRAGQLAGGAMINGEKKRLPLQLESVGVIGDGKASQLAELELRLGYGRVTITM